MEFTDRDGPIHKMYNLAQNVAGAGKFEANYLTIEQTFYIILFALRVNRAIVAVQTLQKTFTMLKDQGILIESKQLDYGLRRIENKAGPVGK